MKKNILIIEDEKKIARYLELELEHEGYSVAIAYDGKTGLEKALEPFLDLIVLDLMLPELSGIEVLRRLRKESDIPVIMLTAKDDISDKVMGLDMGADDYITKPFAIEELLARIRTALRRNTSSGSNDKSDSPSLVSGDLVLFTGEYKVMYKHNEVLLSKKEFELLKYLMENKNMALSRDKILENVWGYDFMGDTNITDVYIRYLRSKLDQAYDVQFIHTVRGVGYSFRDISRPENRNG